ncbi:MAG TPA: endolytic transglycosylase MltG [Candidatus Methanoperedens sp.]|nr:endolytic transglycosylase MltG [Candidatus Methanoperedens sp.]
MIEPGCPSPLRRALAPGLFAVLATGGALAAVLAHALFVAPAGRGASPVGVRIAAGSDLRQIARVLGEAGAVASPGAFVLAARLAGLERRLRPGDYRVDPGLSLPALVRALIDGRGRSVSVTIPEGWRLEQVAERLAAAGVCSRDGFLAGARDQRLLATLAIPGPSAEGFLFPETYAFAVPSDPAEVVRAMHRQFTKVWAELAPPATALTPLQAVTLASIVERETAAPFERPLVAAVFLNRLRLGMPLQADPTVIYGIEGFDGDLRRRDLAAANPYNTYVVRGLPPGPIAAPGRASLAAVLRPAPVDYLYFVARSDGTHQFSRTLAEHNRAVQRFQLATRRGRG